MNLKQLEKLLISHLQESGEIRADLRWLKRSFWVFASGGMSFNVALACYLLWGRN